MDKDLKEFDGKIEIIDHFSSRRNKVCKVKLNSNNENKMVMKIYQDTSSRLIEHENLLKLKQNNINIPDMFKGSKNILFLGYIQGDIINDLAEKLDLGSWIEELALWMSDLHKIKNSEGSFLKGDSNLRNFIWSNDRIYGLDFETLKYGNPKEDIGEICFFLLTNYPSWKYEKKVMVERFLKAYEDYSGLKLDDINDFILKSTKEAKKRRKFFKRI